MMNDLQRAFLSVNCPRRHDNTWPRWDNSALKTDFASRTLVFLAAKIPQCSSNIIAFMICVGAHITAATTHFCKGTVKTAWYSLACYASGQISFAWWKCSFLASPTIKSVLEARNLLFFVLSVLLSRAFYGVCRLWCPHHPPSVKQQTDLVSN